MYGKMRISLYNFSIRMGVPACLTVLMKTLAKKASGTMLQLYRKKSTVCACVSMCARERVCVCVCVCVCECTKKYYKDSDTFLQKLISMFVLRKNFN